jgi:hypothetical protein
MVDGTISIPDHMVNMVYSVLAMLCYLVNIGPEAFLKHIKSKGAYPSAKHLTHIERSRKVEQMKAETAAGPERVSHCLLICMASMSMYVIEDFRLAYQGYSHHMLT